MSGPLHIDAADGDWIKGDRIRVGAEGELYVRDLDAAGGTRRVEPRTNEWAELLDRLDGEARGQANARARERS